MYIYILYGIKKAMICKINIIFNVSVSSLLKCVPESTTSINSTPAVEADTTSGKTNICKNIINSELRLKYAS